MKRNSDPVNAFRCVKFCACQLQRLVMERINERMSGKGNTVRAPIIYISIYIQVYTHINVYIHSSHAVEKVKE